MNVLAVLIAIFLAFPVHALEITSSGVYKLNGNVTSSTIPIRVSVNNVLIDLNGYTVRCTPPDPGIANNTFGIYALSRRNVHVYNGYVTGCFFGIHISNSSNVSVVGVNLSGNTYIGVNVAYSNGVKIRGSTFNNITGYELEAYAVGINGVGSNSLIEGNTFLNFDRQPLAGGVGEGVPILVSSGTANAIIRGNWLENDIDMEAIGIWVASGATNISIYENSLTNFPKAIRGHQASVTDNRLYLRDIPLDPNMIGVDLNGGSASGNLFVNYDFPLGGRIADGGNLFLP